MRNFLSLCIILISPIIRAEIGIPSFGLNTDNNNNNNPTDIFIDGKESFDIEENLITGTSLGNITSVDLDNQDNHLYSLVGGTGDDDNESFAISNGELIIDQILDYETKTSYFFRLRTNDQNGGVFEKFFEVIVSDVNEAPSEGTVSFSISENTIPGLTSLQVEIEDPEGDELSYSKGVILDDDNAFDIDTDGSIILLSELNASEKILHSLEVDVFDGVNTTIITVEINIENVNDLPTDILIDNTSIEENSDINMAVGMLSTVDRDLSDQFIYTLIEGDGDTNNSSFTIDGRDLLVNDQFDFETKSSYSLRIETDDQNGGMFEKSFTLTINDVNEEPMAENQSFSIAENFSIGSTSLFVQASDPEKEDLTYSSGVIIDEENAFDISIDGELILTKELNASEKVSHLLEVDISDGTNTSIVEIEVLIENINDIPTDIILNSDSIRENNEFEEAVGMLVTEDRDLGDQFLYSLVEGDGDANNSSFLISDNVLLANEVFDFETKSSYSIRIQTDDQNGGMFEKALNITIVNINDLALTSQITQPICSDDATGSIAIEVSEFVEPLSFEWSNEETTQNLENITIGNYSLTITDGADMILTEDFAVTNISIYSQTAVCYISAQDTTNLIYVNKGASPFNVNSYLLYREGSIAGIYDFVGEMSSEETFFIDSLINNRSKSFSYKISMRDECGVETIQSNNHSTIHLSVNKGINDEVNLIWTPYTGLEIATYSIYRSTNDGDFVLIDQVSSNNNSFTDFTTSVESNYFYYISISVDDACNTDQNRVEATTEARSNTVIIENVILGLSDQSISIYPNPVADFLNFKNHNTSTLLQVIGTDGKTVIQKHLTSGEEEVNLSSLGEGVYIVKILSGSNLLKQMKIYKN